MQSQPETDTKLRKILGAGFAMVAQFNGVSGQRIFG
tara:strand:+ start:107 stop:214 length:108 start_codon:yes stop_codon:yes gene_type:complete